MKKLYAVLLMVLWPLVIAVSGADATTLEKMSIEKMARAATAIARVRCVSNSTVWQHGEIWTLTTFRVEQTWRGSLTTQITVRSLGGNVGAVTSTVSGVPRFRTGQEAVLFLERNPYGDYFVVSWQQGTFRIREGRGTSDETVTQDTANYAAFDPQTRRVESDGIARMNIAAFRARVESAVSSTEAR